MTPVRQPNFFLVLGMMAVAFALTMFFSFRPENNNVPVADVSAIPRDMGDWKCQGDTPLDPNVMKQMLADSFVSRVYVNARTNQRVELLGVYRRYGRREFAHRPELCYPAGGYTIVKKDRTTLPYAGQERPAVYLLADGSKVQLANGGTGVPPTTVTYVFASGDRTECDFLRQQIWMAFERVIPNKNGWTFIRLSSMRTTNDDDALQAQQDFMRVYGPAIQKVITTDTSAVASARPAPAAANASESFGSFQ
jgi:EpsI family protein